MKRSGRSGVVEGQRMKGGGGDVPKGMTIEKNNSYLLFSGRDGSLELD